VDENGDVFEVWLVKRSFALIAPVCKMGMAILIPVLLIVDPMYSAWDLWPRAISHSVLVVWHMAAMLFFSLVLLSTRWAHTHPARQRVLLLFIGLALLLFSALGVISWLGLGDFSMVAITQLLVACVFLEPGPVRRIACALQSLGIIAILCVLDQSGRFVGELQFINLLTAAAVAYMVDAYMLGNARDLFLQKCVAASERQRADDVLHNALPAPIARELMANNCVVPKAHSRMTVLFADLVGFTQFASTVEADSVVDLLNTMFSRFDALADLHRVEKIKTIGDAYMVVHTGGESAIALFALDLLQAIEALNAERAQHFSLRIGIHAGQTVTGVVGKRRFLYDVWGDAVNVASRMESQGQPGKIQVSEDIFLALSDRFEFSPAGVISVKGRGPMNVYFLLGKRSPDQLAC